MRTGNFNYQPSTINKQFKKMIIYCKSNSPKFLEFVTFNKKMLNFGILIIIGFWLYPILKDIYNAISKR